MTEDKKGLEISLIEYEKELCDEELLSLGQQVAELTEEQREVKRQKNLQVNKYNAILRSIDSKIDNLVTSIGKKSQTVEEECVPEYLYSQNIVRFSTVADGKVVLERELNEEEKQMKVF